MSKIFYSKLLITITTLIIFSSPASAQNSWDGWFVGLTAGYSQGDTNLKTKTEFVNDYFFRKV